MGNKAQRRVTILLSVFNGQAFLPQMLFSLAEQKGVEWQLLWHDDGSSDQSVQLLKDFASRYPGRVSSGQSSGQKLGIARAYMALLREASVYSPFMAFADQDDVWLPFKLYKAVQALTSITHEKCALYCSRQILVDTSLNYLGLSPEIKKYAPFPFALTHNMATGCTVVFNQSTAKLLAFLPNPPEETFHDWWVFLCVNAVGGIVFADEGADILYRQHARNVVGTTPSFLKRASRAFKRGPQKFIKTLKANVEALLQAEDLLPAPTLSCLYDLQAVLASGRLVRYIGFLRAHFSTFRRQNIVETLVLYLWFIANAFSRQKL
ncbi:glycosyltransferase [Entomobacter blattae]|uniref:glycosyltransferase n=1 Tax=Entomobacter blattae TaxID=2762277 RepID=UPI00193BCF8E|nr:glycosyltransferase [Entomobacter blattae]